jgi:hypothetical protein
LTEFTSAIGWRSTSSRTSVSAWSKFPRERDDAGAVHQRLGELARRDLAFGDDHGAAQPAAGRVRRRAGRGVARRRADDRLRPFAHGGGHRAGHPPVLERARRVGALDLQVHVGADALGQPGRVHERRGALLERHDGVVLGEREAVAIALDETDAARGLHQTNSSSMTRIARGAERMKSSCPISRRRRRSATRAAGARPSRGGRSRPGRSGTTDLIDAPCRPRIWRHLGEHAGTVGDLEVQVEGRLDVVGELQVLVVSGVEAGGIIALTTSPSTALAGLRPAGARAGHGDLR